jgi:two-component system LytT family response regulator
VISAIRAIIVDDEPLTRERVRDLANKSGDIEVIGEGSNGIDALDLVATLKPDLVFIDVEMPELNGFGVISELDSDAMPAIIFITAYEHYAKRAFDVGAIDYLHKPITPPRFAAAIARAKDRLNRPSPAEWRQLVASATLAERARGARRRFVVRRGSSHYFVPVDDVDWIDAADNYLRLHVGTKTHFARGTMKQAEDDLDPARFVRVHRSAIVAVDRISAITSADSGGHLIELRDGTQIRSSRQYNQRIDALLS